MTSLDIQLIKNARQQFKAQLHLDQVMRESKHFIKKALYKKAFQLVDRFLLQYNTKNQLTVGTRITLRRRSIYTLSKILFKMAIKNVHGIDKFQVVVNRISTLLDEQYLDLHLLVQNTSSVVQSIMQLQNTESLSPSEFQLNHVCEIHLTGEIKGFFGQVIRIIRNVGLFYRSNQDIRGVHYLEQSEKFSRTLINQTDKFEGMSLIVVENQKSQLTLNSSLFEWGWTDKVHSNSFYLEHQLIKIMNKYQIQPDPKLRYRMKRMIKILSMTLLFENYLFMDEGKIDEAHEILTLIDWMLQSYIPINQDDLKHHIMCQIRQLQPRYEEYLLAKHELALIFMDCFGEDHWIYQKQTETQRNKEEVTMYQQGIQHRFNSICFKKYSVDNIKQIYITERPIPVLKIDNQSSAKKTTPLQQETFHDHTTLDQLSSVRSSNVFQQQQRSLSNSVLKSDRPRISSQTNNMEYNFDNLPKTAREHINFDFRIPNRHLEIQGPEGRLDIDLDRILKKEVFKALMKHDQSKHSSLVQEQFQKFLRQNSHDNKNIEFEHKMLAFKKFTNQLLPPPKDVLTRQTLRLQMCQYATVQQHVDQVKQKKNTQNEESSEESLLSFELPGKILTPKQKFRKILFKYKTVFKLDNLRAKLKARQKEKKLAQLARAQRKTLGMNTYVEKQKVDESEIIQKTFKKSKELFLTYLKAVENEKARLDEEVASPNFRIRGKLKQVRSNSKEEKNLELRKRYNDLFESTKNQGAAKASSGGSLADLIKVSVARNKLKKH